MVKSPEQLKKEEMILVGTNQKRIVGLLETQLQEVFDRAFRDGSLTSSGGTIEVFIGSGVSKAEAIKFVPEFFDNFGWNCTYTPKEYSWWSMTAKSYVEGSKDYFRLTPKK